MELKSDGDLPVVDTLNSISRGDYSGYLCTFCPLEQFSDLSHGEYRQEVPLTTPLSPMDDFYADSVFRQAAGLFLLTGRLPRVGVLRTPTDAKRQVDRLLSWDSERNVAWVTSKIYPMTSGIVEDGARVIRQGVLADRCFTVSLPPDVEILRVCDCGEVGRGDTNYKVAARVKRWQEAYRSIQGVANSADRNCELRVMDCNNHVVASSDRDNDKVASSASNTDQVTPSGGDNDEIASSTEDMASGGNDDEVMASGGDELASSTSNNNDDEVMASGCDNDEIPASAEQHRPYLPFLLTILPTKHLSRPLL